MEQKINWHDFWSREGNPGFHEEEGNGYLKQFLPSFDLNPGDHVFLPLCGKTVDMLWLVEQGFTVSGVELSEVAVKAFFEESGIDYKVEPLEDFTCYYSDKIKIYHGNFIDLKPWHLQSCQLVYDRAAIIAIEPDIRHLYSQHMLHIIPQTAAMMVILLEYDQEVISGPPFSVTPGEIESCYAKRYQIETLFREEMIDQEPRWRERGLKSFKETVLKLAARQ
jgi:thiopurine S-methyltransferase